MANTGTQHTPQQSNANPSGAALRPLGSGLRLVQVALAFQVAAGYLSAATINPNYFAYDLSLFRAVFDAVFSVLGIWMIARRARVARPFIIGSATMSLVMMIVDLTAGGAGADIARVIGPTGLSVLVCAQVIFLLAIAGYLLLAKRPRKELIVRLRSLTVAEKYLAARVPMSRRMRHWPFWRDLAIYFVVFSFLGHWAEMLFCLLIAAGVFMGDFDLSNAMLWEQWLYPFSAEGIALALIVLLLHPLKEWLMKKTGNRVAIALPLSFLANALVCTSIDFTLGITANYDYHLWDYRNLPFNFMGQIVLQNSLVYSIAATLIVWVFYPLMDRGMSKLPRWFADALFWVLVGAYGFLALFHFMYLSPNGLVFG